MRFWGGAGSRVAARADPAACGIGGQLVYAVLAWLGRAVRLGDAELVTVACRLVFGWARDQVLRRPWTVSSVLASSPAARVRTARTAATAMAYRSKAGSGEDKGTAGSIL